MSAGVGHPGPRRAGAAATRQALVASRETRQPADGHGSKSMPPPWSSYWRKPVPGSPVGNDSNACWTQSTWDRTYRPKPGSGCSQSGPDASGGNPGILTSVSPANLNGLARRSRVPPGRRLGFEGLDYGRHHIVRQRGIRHPFPYEFVTTRLRSNSNCREPYISQQGVELVNGGRTRHTSSP